LPVIGVKRSALLGAVAPGFAASSVMAGLVWVVDTMILPELAVLSRLSILVAVGATAYGALLLTFERRVVDEVLGLIRPARPAAQTL